MAAQLFYTGIAPAYKSGLRAMFVILCLASADALIGGGISSGLRFECGWWSPEDQGINDFYQLGFGLACGLVLCWLVKVDCLSALVLLVLLLSYVEDVLYYVFLPVFSPVFVWRGFPAVAPGLPNEISGWVGFSSRVLHMLFDTPEIKLCQLCYLLLAVLGVAAAVGLVEWKKESEGV